MIGSIIGDIAGAPYEMDKLGQDRKDYRPFFLNGLAKFTDDTNLTIAVADALLTGTSFAQKYLEWHKKNPDLGYGSSFKAWAEKGGTYINDSRGDGAAMRVSPIALFSWKQAGGLESKFTWAMQAAIRSAEPTHNCLEGYNGAKAVVAGMILAADKATKEEIRETIEKMSGYDLSATVDEVREKWSKRDIRCNITVPQAFICFLESKDFEDAIRLSVYSKGDVDTIAAIAGGLAESFYGVDSISPEILAETKLRLQPEMIGIIDKMYDGSLKW